MSTKHPRLLVVLDAPLHKWIRRAARAEGVSLSLKARDVIRAAYEEAEDVHWARVGAERLSAFRHANAKTHAQVWSRARHA